MAYKSQEVKVESVEKIIKNWYKIRVKLKNQNQSGKFIMISNPGYGESPLYVASDNESYTEFLVKRRGNNTKQICRLTPKGRTWVRGPYGRGFPMNNLKNKNIYIISEGNGFCASRSLIGHLLSKRNDYKNISIYLVFYDQKNVLLQKEIDEWNQKFNTQKFYSRENEKSKDDYSKIISKIKKEEIPHDSMIIINTSKELLKSILLAFDEKNIPKKRIYFTYERKMQCGIGKCGTCLIHGRKTCKDGPVFRYDEIDITNVANEKREEEDE